MASLPINQLGRNARKLRVDTLVRLRWLAIAGQLAAVLIVRFGFGFPLPLNFCMLVIGTSAALNISLRFTYARSARLEDRPAAVLLGFDLLQLLALLYLTGGIDNPFMTMALAPVAISAVSLPRRYAFYLLALMISVSLLLTFCHLPLPWKPGALFALPDFYRAGIWTTLGLAGIFVSLYASRVAQEARLLSDALAATELILAREQHLSQLDGLAAAAAHELGTPLATIALVTKELANHPGHPPALDDLDLLSQQVRRCRTILSTLTSLGHDSGGLLETISISVLLEEVMQPHRNFDITVQSALSGSGPEPLCIRSPGISYGLGNLVENAVDFARSRVTLHAQWSGRRVIVTISDDGPGIAPEVLARLGEPYVTTRGRERASETVESSGMGLGLFIAKTLLERSGAQFQIVSENGAIVRIIWPLEKFEQGVHAAANISRY